ncbi:MAG: methionine ABC transporter permease [Clostridium sp.]
MVDILAKALGETLFMTFFATIFSVLIGFELAVILILTDKNGLKPNKFIYTVLDVIINVFRSFPFIILIVFVIPFTRLIMGSFTGPDAMIVPLTIGASPFVARIIEAALKEVDPGVVEAARSFGASDMQIIFKVMLKEAVPSIISGITLTVITIIGYSAMAGAVGGGGLGNAAISYGFHRFDTQFMIVTVIVIIVLVQGLQMIGNYLYKKLSK